MGCEFFAHYRDKVEIFCRHIIIPHPHPVHDICKTPNLSPSKEKFRELQAISFLL